MATLTVRFLGICTHFSQANHSHLPLAHRVVLVNGSDVTIHAQRIPQHIARLKIADKESETISGVRMELQAVSTPFRDEAFDLPNLTDLVRGVGETMPLPSQPVVFDNNAALYFDTNVGTLTASCSSKAAIFAQLTVEADEFTLITTPFGSPVSTERRFTADTEIAISNDDADPEQQATVDFLLHYLTADSLPRLLPIPEPCVPPDSSFSWGTIGAGCSNSNYP